VLVGQESRRWRAECLRLLEDGRFSRVVLIVSSCVARAAHGQTMAIFARGGSMSKKDVVLHALRSKAEYAEGDWGTVYLDNARPSGMSDKSFRSYLAALSKEGLYKVVDGYAWGSVRMEPDVQNLEGSPHGGGPAGA
jgi:hypothetical protein